MSSNKSFKSNVINKLFTCKSHTHTHTHTYIHIYIYIYIYIYIFIYLLRKIDNKVIQVEGESY